MGKYKRLFKELSRGIMLIISIGFSILPNFFDFSSIIQNANVLRGFGIILFIVVVLWYLIDLENKFLWSEPDISYLPYPEDKYTKDNYYKSAILEICNREELPITNCSATLKLANDISVDEKDHTFIIPLIPSLKKKSDKIKWDEELDMDKNCEITIPAHDSKHVNVASLLGTLRYHLREGDFEACWAIHTVKIRIDGCFNKKEMKPLEFNGYIYATNLKKESFSGNGKIKSREEINKEQIHNLRMIFKTGNWEEDNDIIGYLKIN
jgi:hypothetical protein